MKKLLLALTVVLTMGFLFSSVHAFQGTDRLVCGTDEGNGIWCTSYDGMEHGVWVKMPGALKQVVVREGQLWGVNAQGQIFYAPDINSLQWLNIQGNAKEIAEGHGVLCHVNVADEVWCADHGINTPNPRWHKAPGGVRLKFISVN